MIFQADYHIHSVHSSDSTSEIEELASTALERGICEIAITDHIDLNYPPVSYYQEEDFDYGSRLAEIGRTAEKYAERLRIVQGAEVGLQPGSKKRIETYMSHREFDFIIGSTHVVDFMDLYDGVFFTGKTPHEAYMRYYEDILEAVALFDMYHVYGHLDCVNRYCPYPGYDYADFRGITDEILSALIKKGKGIEVNSSGIRYGVGACHPAFEIIKRYRELGGEIITAGSDAHRLKDVGSGLLRIYGMLKEAGFKAVTVYRGGEPVFVDI